MKSGLVPSEASRNHFIWLWGQHPWLYNPLCNVFVSCDLNYSFTHVACSYIKHSHLRFIKGVWMCMFVFSYWFFLSLLTTFPISWPKFRPSPPSGLPLSSSRFIYKTTVLTCDLRFSQWGLLCGWLVKHTCPTHHRLFESVMHALQVHVASGQSDETSLFLKTHFFLCCLCYIFKCDSHEVLALSFRMF